MKLLDLYSVLHRRLRQCCVNRPGTKPLVQGRNAYSNVFGPLTQGLRFAVEANMRVVTCVTALLLLGSPAAIIWLVVRVIIDAINGVSGAGAWSHILVESLKALQPAIAHTDAPTAVAGIALMFWVCATTDQGCPSAIFRAIREPVLHMQFSHRFFSLATAVRGLSSQEMRSADRRFCATDTATTPVAFLSFDFSESNYRPSAKCHSSEVVRSGRNWGMIVHVGSLLQRLSATHLGVRAPQVHFYDQIIHQRGKKRRTRVVMPYWGRFEDVLIGT